MPNDRPALAEAERALRCLRKHPGLLRLQGRVQHYEWGGDTFIPELLGLQNSDREPYAELWLGAHPAAPALAEVAGVPIALDRLVKDAPETILGPAAAARFAGRLPYLLKVLDARHMLSIQAHPTKHQAEEGFAREEAGGIPLDAPYRNYKDDNHKPEVQVALTDFWMLHGFRPLEEIAATLREVPEFAGIMPEFGDHLRQVERDAYARRALLRALYGAVMTMPQEEVNARLDALVARLEQEGTAERASPDFWALRAAESFPLPQGGRDRGLFSIYLLNLVHLRPGQGTFQPAGTLHAYLEGITMELMANSDNVLRGGLTGKHVDVPELMRTLTFDSGPPVLLNGEAVSATETVYRAPVEEFELSRIEVGGGRIHAGRAQGGPDCGIVLEGAAQVGSDERGFVLERGGVFLAPWGVEYAIEARGPSAVLFKASLPASGCPGG